MERKFDVIIASHFLEHLAPAILFKYVECLKKLSEPSGTLVADAPIDDFVRFPYRRIHGNAPRTCFSRQEYSVFCLIILISRCLELADPQSEHAPTPWWRCSIEHTMKLIIEFFLDLSHLTGTESLSVPVDEPSPGTSVGDTGCAYGIMATINKYTRYSTFWSRLSVH